MGWVTLYDNEGPDCWTATTVAAPAAEAGLLPRGSIVVETHVPASDRVRSLLQFRGDGPRPLTLLLQTVPGGGLTLIVERGGAVLHRTIGHSDIGRAEALRLTYSWDMVRHWARIGLERTETEKVHLEIVEDPQPLRVAEAAALARPGPDYFVAPDVAFVAVSTDIEPVGPMPSLTPETPVATPQGYRAAGGLRRGDTVLTSNGDSVPVLRSLRRTVPASGGFRPVGLRAPYFGLQRDLVLAPAQRLVLKGSEVEYLFGCEAVLAAARHLAAGAAAGPVCDQRFVTYCQVLLPRHEALMLAGAEAESLYIGRLRRNRDLLAASLLSGAERRTLPDHGPPIHPVLRAFDALVLTEQRAA